MEPNLSPGPSWLIDEGATVAEGTAAEGTWGTECEAGALFSFVSPD